MGSRPAVLFYELFFEAGFQQAFTYGRFFLFELGWHGDIAIEGCQRKIIEFSRTGIEAIQTMCPSPDENDLAEPGLNRNNEFRKRFEFGFLFVMVRTTQMRKTEFFSK